ncbi:MAG: hypothetical protein JNJ61_30805 [Anaerolineae bacterium]|nr:hypothetical protein [Anaerolineae bacterium]
MTSLLQDLINSPGLFAVGALIALSFMGIGLAFGLRWLDHWLRVLILVALTMGTLYLSLNFNQIFPSLMNQYNITEDFLSNLSTEFIVAALFAPLALAWWDEFSDFQDTAVYRLFGSLFLVIPIGILSIILLYSYNIVPRGVRLSGDVRYIARITIGNLGVELASLILVCVVAGLMLAVAAWISKIGHLNRLLCTLVLGVICVVGFAFLMLLQNKPYSTQVNAKLITAIIGGVISLLFFSGSMFQQSLRGLVIIGLVIFGFVASIIAILIYNQQSDGSLFATNMSVEFMGALIASIVLEDKPGKDRSRAFG